VEDILKIKEAYYLSFLFATTDNRELSPSSLKKLFNTLQSRLSSTGSEENFINSPSKLNE